MERDELMRRLVDGFQFRATRSTCTVAISGYSGDTVEVISGLSGARQCVWNVLGRRNRIHPEIDPLDRAYDLALYDCIISIRPIITCN